MTPHSTRNDTDFLRFIAIILIVNSHLDAYYPLPMLATGGMLGNSLFFMLSAFGLAASWEKHPRPFSEWFGGRARRIFPSIWAFHLLLVFPLSIVQGAQLFDRQLDFLSFLFFPQGNWFIRALLVYYLVIFALVSRGPAMRLYLHFSVAITSLAYLAIYFLHQDLGTFTIERGNVKLLFYLLVVFMGIGLYLRNAQIAYDGIWDFVAVTVYLLLMYSVKTLNMHGIALRFQCLQQLLVFPVLYYSLKAVRSELVMRRLMSCAVVRGVVQYVSGLTLEIFLVHGILKEYIITWSLVFPVNIVVLLISTMMVAVLIKRVAHFIAERILTERLTPLGSSP